MLISPFEPGGVVESNTSANQAAASAVMGKDDFLRLLVTQLGNQDPLNPMDGQEFAAQLAQFSSVEQLLNISDVLAQNGEMNGLLAQSINSGVAAGLIGKNVQASGNAISWDGENPPPINFELADGAEVVTVTIHNETGDVVRTLELPAHFAGEHTLEWDGLDATGQAASSGTYTVEVLARDSEGNPVEAESFVSGIVDRITFGQDGIMLWIGKTRVPMSAVESVE